MALENELDAASVHLRPSPDGSDLRKLTEEDVPRISKALARSFEDDPVMGWVFPRDEIRLGRLEQAFGLYLRKIWLLNDECYATDRLFGAALWLPPGKWHLSPLEQLRLLPSMISVNRGNLPRLMRVLRLMEVSHPKEPDHYYLAVLGVEPEFQGRGFGSALMQPILERCDRERIPAYLESSKPRNCILYERHGFKTVEEIRLPKEGPPIWRMWRDPQS
jgi:GNAT superfamily N-acetyltransferase